MNPGSPASSIVHDWVKAQGIALDAEDQASQRIAVTVDSVRVHLSLRGSSGILLEARVLDLPAEDRARERVLERAMQAAAARMRERAFTLCSDEASRSLWLQLMASPGSLQAISDDVARLVDEVELWRKVL